MSLFKKNTLTCLAFLGILNIVTLSHFAFGSERAEAADTRYFNPSNIISDSIFADGNAMTVDQIQQFLISKNSVCLMNFQTLSLHDANGDGLGDEPYGRGVGETVSAATLIWQAAKLYSINPKVILATLQKEQGLITRGDCPAWRYNTALGYGCPDTEPCDQSAYGFTRQIDYGVWHFQGFYNDTYPVPPYVRGEEYVAYNPDHNCGGTVLNIQNRATAALYSYTPYQPNADTLAAAPGQTVHCGAYGNLNFWRYFTDWFGSTIGGDNISSIVKLTNPISINPSDAAAGQTATVSYTVQNTSSRAINFQNSILQCRFNTSSNCDSALNGATSLAAGEVRTFTNTVTFTNGGTYRLVPFFMENGIWYRYGSEGVIQNGIQIQVPDVRLTTDITSSPQSLIANQPATFTVKIKNFSSQQIAFQDTVLQCRYNLSTNCDSKYTGPLTLAAGEERTFTYTIQAQNPGDYSITPYFLSNGVWHKYKSSTNTIQMNIPDMRLTSPITYSPSQPIPGQALTVSYGIKNFGSKSVTYQNSVLQCRYNTSTNCDTGLTGQIVINPGEERVFSETIPPTKAGSYKLVPYYLVNGTWYQYDKGINTANNITINIPKYNADVRMIDQIAVTPSDPVPGQSVNISFTIKNFDTQPAIYQTSLLQCRYNTSKMCDTGTTGTVNLAPSEERVFSYTLPMSSIAGNYKVVPYYMQNDTWHQYRNDSGSNSKIFDVAPYKPDMRIVSDILISPQQPAVGSSYTISYTVRNFGTKPAIHQNSLLQCRYNTSIMCDSPSRYATTINPGESATYTETISSAKAGTYRFVPYYMQNNTWYQYGKEASYDNQKILTIH